MARKPKTKREQETGAKARTLPSGRIAKLPGSRGKYKSEEEREKVFMAVCERLCEGENLTEICRDKNMPTKGTVLKWVATRPDYADQYARARAMLVDAFAYQTIDIADNCTDPAKARVQFDARRWFAAKIEPKKYGDRVTAELDVNVAERRQKHIEIIQMFEAKAQDRREREEAE